MAANLAHSAAPAPGPRYPISTVDTADVPGGGLLRLLESNGDYSIQFGSEELMGSTDRVSEEALATMACARMADPAGRVLIGGLGMGFTLGAALAVLPATATIVVAELVQKVVTWAQGPLAHIHGDNLADPRVTLAIRDVHDVIAEAPGQFDVILLDVDNGPDALIQLANDRLYCNWGLKAAHTALKPGGLLAVWSAYTDPDFVVRLERAGFAVEEEQVQATERLEDGMYTLWFAARRD